MKDIDYTKDCLVTVDRVMFNAVEEVRLFSSIMGYSFDEMFHVANDPHGVVCLCDEFYDMSDIHTVIKEYPKLREKYKTNRAIEEIISEWYFYSLDMRNHHRDKPCINLKSWLMGARPEMLNKFND